MLYLLRLEVFEESKKKDFIDSGMKNKRMIKLKMKMFLFKSHIYTYMDGKI